MSSVGALWQKCTVLEARVRRVVGSIVFLDLPPPFRSATTRKVDGWDPVVGDGARIAGLEDGRLPGDGAGGRGFRPLLVLVGGQPRLLVGEAELPNLVPAMFPRAPSPPPPWLAALVRHGLIDDARKVPAAHFDLDPINVIVAGSGLEKRGIVHVDWKWWNDTRDIVGDLATIAGARKSFSLVRLDVDSETLVFESNGKRIEVEATAGDLTALGAAMNAVLDELGVAQRLYDWSTGGDSLAILARTPAQVDALRREVPVGDLELFEE